MLVYGDPSLKIDLLLWRERLAAPLSHATWIERHAELAARLIETGQVLQALEDEAFARAGDADRELPHLSSLRQRLMALAGVLTHSLAHRQTPPPLPPLALDFNLPPSICARAPEGYAFYALYPEACAAAARQLGSAPSARVIGLRSIGASLAPIVAAQMGARDFSTLRPKGPAFRREIVAPELAAQLAAAPFPVVIVDEGPGLSGSSVASAAEFVRRVSPRSPQTLLTSHAGPPGPEASARTRALFASTPRLCTDFSETLRVSLPEWAADIAGRARAPLENISGGAWRRLCYAEEAQWPAVDPMQERLKFLLHAEHGCFLLKFVGLGDIGARKARLAMQLSDAQLAPRALAYRHGFLVEQWRSDARPLDAGIDRAQLAPAQRLTKARRHVPFVQANLIRTAQDDAALVEQWRKRLQHAGVWANDPVPLYPYPSSPDYRKLFGPPDESAWERAHAHYLAQFEHFSDIQDERPASLEELEAACDRR